MRAVMVCLAVCGLVGGNGVAATVAPVRAAGAPRVRTVIPVAPRLSTRKFQVNSVAELRQARAQMTPMSVKTAAPPLNVMRPSRTISVLRPAQSPYATGKGVVLDVRNPLHGDTNSAVLVNGVMFNSSLVYDLQYGHDDMVLYQLVPNTRFDACSASFSELPAGPHTYLLTVGHSADPKYLSVKVNGQEFAADKLTPNAATSEVRLLFTYDATANGKTVNAIVYCSYPESAAWDYQTFHHVQLAVVD